MAAQNNNTATNPQPGHQEKKSEAGKGWLYMIPIILVGIIIIKFIFSSSDNPPSKGNNDENNNPKGQIEQSSRQGYEEKKHVTYEPGPDYGDIIYIPSGFDYYFKDATEPYCYCNDNGLFNCGERGEDATGKLGDGPQNKKLRFKSQNNKKGELDIILIKK